MGEGSAPRTMAARSLTRNLGEDLEKKTFQGEASFPSSLTLEEGIRDLQGEEGALGICLRCLSCVNTYGIDVFGHTHRGHPITRDPKILVEAQEHLDYWWSLLKPRQRKRLIERLLGRIEP